MAHAAPVFSQPRVPVFEPYVDETVVADFLGITPRRILQLARARQIPAHAIGNQRKTWRFRLSEIEEHLNSPAGRSIGVNIGSAVPGTQEKEDLE